MRRYSSALFVMCVLVAGCNSGSQPPDLVKTQRETMDKAKDIGTAMQSADEARRERVDETSK